MSQGNRKDERLPTGAIVYWSRKVNRGRYYLVPAWCPDCKRERTIFAGHVAEDGFTGRCAKCRDLQHSAAARSEYPTADERLNNGCVVHWSEMFSDTRGFLSVPVTCSGCQRKRPVRASDTRRATFTGWCDKHKRLDTGRAPGTKCKDGRGYVLVKLTRDHPFYDVTNKSGWVKEHRLVMAESLGRPLTRNETVHHRNGRKDDNRLENLELWCGNHPSGRRVADSEDLATKILAGLVREMLAGREW